MESASDDIFLNGVIGHPEVFPDIFAAARFDDLFRADRAFLLTIAGDKAGLGQNAALIFAKLDFLHGFAGVDQPGKVLRNGIDAFDDVMLDIALMGNAHVLEPLSRHKAVGADETQHPGEHLVAARTVMRIDDDDFRRLRLADAVIPAQAQHMLGVAVAAPVTRNRLHGEEREPSFAPQPLHDVDGGDIDVTLRPAVMGLAGEDGRDMTQKRFVVECFAPADLVAVAAEPGGKVMIGHDLNPYGLGLQRSAALQPWPSPRPGGARRKGGRAEGDHPACTSGSKS